MHQSPDEREIYDLQQAWLDAWNRADAEAVSACCTKDCVRIGIRGDLQHGREAIRTAMADLFQAMPGSKLKLGEQTVRLLSPEVAVWRGHFTLARPAGDPIEGHAVEVLQKVKGRWLIAETHPRVFAPPSILAS